MTENSERIALALERIAAALESKKARKSAPVESLIYAKPVYDQDSVEGSLVNYDKLTMDEILSIVPHRPERGIQSTKNKMSRTLISLGWTYRRENNADTSDGIRRVRWTRNG